VYFKKQGRTIIVLLAAARKGCWFVKPKEKTTAEELVQAVVELKKNFTMPVYRGQADKNWLLQSSALRRLKNGMGKDFPQDDAGQLEVVGRYHEQLIEPMDVIHGPGLTKLQKLAILRHYGAATGFLDFTANLLVAIWFACNEEPDRDGKVFALDIGSPLASRIDSLTSLAPDGGPPIVYYEPDRSLGPRVIAQQSYLVHGTPSELDRLTVAVAVPKQLKKAVLEHLTNFGLSELTLYGDAPGVAAANTIDKELPSISLLSPTQHRDMGTKAYREGRYEDALASYRLFAVAQPDVAQPYCLKGDALAALGRFTEADEAYTLALEKVGRPIEFGPQAVATKELIDSMSQMLHYNRGNVRAAVSNHRDAVADYDQALQLGHGFRRDVLYNRGNSKLALNSYPEAHEDFMAAWSDRKGSDAALAMGNCMAQAGEFEEALKRYRMGVAAEPENLATQCQNHAEKISQLLKVLGEQTYEMRHDGPILRLKLPSGKFESFIFQGGRGNTGNAVSGMVNAPGGKGYRGTMGFVIAIEPLVR